MSAARLLIPFLLLVASPLTLPAQTWSPEQQELLDHFLSVVDRIEETNEANHSLWKEAANPREDVVMWFTEQGALYDLTAFRKWHQAWETRGAEYTFLNARPIAIRIIDSVGMIWYWHYGERLEKDGERHQWEEKRLEIFQKTPEGWRFVGGMSSPVVPFETGGS
jgi:hypothetical protein